jgi:hypothetical protein
MTHRNPLLEQAIEAHGGLDRWNRFEKVEAQIDSGGGFFRFKGVPLVGPRQLTVWLHEQRAMIAPVGADGPRVLFTPNALRSSRRTAPSSPNGPIPAPRSPVTR